MSRYGASLRRLARHHGVHLSYLDNDGRVQHASDDALLATLGALGAGVERMADVEPACREAAAVTRARIVEPVVVAWEGAPLRFTSAPGLDSMSVAISCADGSVIDGRPRIADANERGATAVLDVALPAGVHTLDVRCGRQRATSRIVAAPRRAHPLPERAWGIFAPCYALRDERERPIGDLTALAALGRAVAAYGATYVSTLPLLPLVDPDRDPSPYSPSSRSLWSELVLDPARLPESVSSARSARPAPHSALVDWPAVRAATEDALDQAVARLGDGSGAVAALDRFLVTRPDVAAYARFRAGAEGNRTMIRRYEYAQWQAVEQMEHLRRDLAAHGQALYLDLPVGSAHAGFDVHRRPDGFACGASVGAPPGRVLPRGPELGLSTAATRGRPCRRIPRPAGRARPPHVGRRRAADRPRDGSAPALRDPRWHRRARRRLRRHAPRGAVGDRHRSVPASPMRSDR